MGDSMSPHQEHFMASNLFCWNHTGMGIPVGFHQKNYIEVHLGVSDHHKASLEPIFFFKHQCALFDHNIFMKQIWYIDHSGIF